MPPPSSSRADDYLVVVGVGVFGAARPDATEVVGGMKAALVRCFENDSANLAGAHRRQRHVRLRMAVDASGKVHEPDLPEWDPSNPLWNAGASGSPRPNPLNVGDAAIRCLKARARRSRFKAADGPSTITVDVRTMPQR